MKDDSLLINTWFDEIESDIACSENESKDLEDLVNQIEFLFEESCPRFRIELLTVGSIASGSLRNSKLEADCYLNVDTGNLYFGSYSLDKDNYSYVNLKYLFRKTSEYLEESGIRAEGLAVPELQISLI